MTAVPNSQREAVLALGATRWGDDPRRCSAELPDRDCGRHHAGAGARARRDDGGDDGDRQSSRHLESLFAPGYTLASVIANEFSEATDDMYLSALIEIGLALFLVTIVVNTIARLLVWAVTRGARRGWHNDEHTTDERGAREHFAARAGEVDYANDGGRIKAAARR